MIAMAIACKPEILIADEPTTALDVTIQAQILDLLQELQRETGMAIVLITHDLGVVARMADSVAVMYAGKVVERGSVDDIFYRSAHPYTLGLKAAMPSNDPTRKQSLQPIEGSPPDLFSPPPGCGYAPRCPHAMKVCQLSSAETGRPHGSRCWLHDADSPFKPAELHFLDGGSDAEKGAVL
jgi:oligopeptide/dipeptide ABC transporter ATP-binding protein